MMVIEYYAKNKMDLLLDYIIVILKSETGSV